MPNTLQLKFNSWKSIIEAIGAEFRETDQIMGQSGMLHPLEALGIDESQNRLIIIPREHNPRVAALIRGDVQQSLPSTRVMVARPITIDIAHVARAGFLNEAGMLDVAKILQIASALKDKTLRSEKIAEMFPDITKGTRLAMHHTTSSKITQFMTTIEQLFRVDWGNVKNIMEGDYITTLSNSIQQLTKIDNLAADREYGICPIPTYEFSENDWDMILSETKIDEIKEKLRQLNIHQYFFPPKDEMIVGLIDRGVNKIATLSDCAKMAEAQGHIPARNNIIDEIIDIPDIVEALSSKGYVVESDFSVEITENGKHSRTDLRLRPREGLIARLSKIVSIKVDIGAKDLKDLI